jgi:hypothetical protein
MTLAALVFEGLVAALLVVAVVMCLRVDRRLSALKKGQDGVQSSVIALNEATDRARAALAAVERATKQNGKTLEAQVADARKLSEELRLVTGKADRHIDEMANRAGARPARRRASDYFPEGAGSRVINDLKDVR